MHDHLRMGDSAIEAHNKRTAYDAKVKAERDVEQRNVPTPPDAAAGSAIVTQRSSEVGPGEIVELLGTVATSGLAGVVDPSATVVSVVLAVLPQSLGMLFPTVFASKKKRIERWWEDLTFVNAAEEGVASDVRARLQDPTAADVIWESVRSVLEALIPDVVPAMALLAREYLQESKPRDRFFRGFSRVLQDVSVEEFKSLEILVAELQSVEVEGTRIELHLLEPTRRNPSPSAEYVAFVRGRERNDVGLTTLQRSIPHAADLFHLLKTHGIASELPTGAWEIETGPFVIVIEKNIARRLARYFR